MTHATGTSHLAARAISVKASIRTRMLKLASGLDDVVTLGRGDPDFDTPPSIVREGMRALEAGETHYTAPAGLMELRQAISAKLDLDNGLSYAPDQILVTNGCQEALLIAILALVDPGDEVILQAPRFNAFDYMVNLAGGRVVDVPTRQEDDFALKAPAIRKVVTDRTKLLVVANPNNPTGGLTGREDLLEIAELASEKDLLVISDEIYEKLLFDGATHHSLAGLGSLYDRTVTVNGFSKAYAMTGWRVGYLAAPAWLMEPAVEIKHTMSICTPPALQRGAIAALEGGHAAVAGMLQEYQERLDLILEGLDGLGITYGRPGGGMYVYANVSSTGMDAETFCFELLRQERVMIFPGTMFADPGNQHVRITLLSSQSAIREALERMGQFIARL
jgi:aminotransferase